ncbi:MAG: TraC family protein, partial [Bdellovibrionota bacterium]
MNPSGHWNPKDVLGRALANHEIFAKAFLTRPESLSGFLPYDEYLEQYGVFLNRDGSLGALYEVTLCQHETKTSSEITELVQKLQQWFRFNEGTVLQLHFEQRPVVGSDIPLALAPNATTERSLPGDLFNRRMERLQKAEIHGRYSEMAYQRRLILSIKQMQMNREPLKARAIRVADALRDSHSTLSHELSTILRRIRSFQNDLTQLESGTPLDLRRMDGTDLVCFLRQQFSPKIWPLHHFSKWNPKIPISRQVTSRGMRLNHSGIRRDGLQSRVLTLKNAPAFAYPGAMAYFLALPFPFRIVMNVSFPAAGQIKRHFAVKEFFLQNTPSAQARRQKAEVEALQGQLVAGDRVVQMTFSVILEAEADEELETRSHRVLALFRDRLESEAIVEDTIGMGLWLSSLPFNYHPIADYTSQRAVRLLRSDLAHFCPVFDSFRGLPEKQSVFLSRESNLVGFSLRSTGNSHHTAVIGDTGSAKSGLVISLLLAEMRRDPKPIVFVIDRKTSYGMVSN